MTWIIRQQSPMFNVAIGLPPVITGASFALSTPGTSGQHVGTLLATNSPTSWDITAGDPNGNFSIDNSGNLTISANGVSGLTTGSQTLTVLASNTAGNGTGSVTVQFWADGSVAAPSGTLQYPHLLDVNSSGTQMFGVSLATRPPWRVAGVDYYVGIDRNAYPSDSDLSDPSTISIAGVSVNVVTHIVAINSGSNILIEGIDFSLDGGWQLQPNGGTNITIKNCKFVVGANGLNPIYATGSFAASNVTVTQCYIDGGGTAGFTNSNQGSVAWNCRGNSTWTYNYFPQASAENMVCVTASGKTDGTWTFKYNALGNGGMAWTPSGIHGDWIQFYNGSGGLTTELICDFNLFFQFAETTSSTSGPRTQGLSNWSAGGNVGEIQNYSTSNNTFMGIGVSAAGNGVGPCVTPFLTFLAPKVCSGNMQCTNNFYDPTLYSSGGWDAGSFMYVSNSYGGSASQGAFTGSLNGTYPPSTCFTAGTLPGGNTNIMTGNLLKSTECSLNV